jgi:hypothetical protein
MSSMPKHDDRQAGQVQLHHGFTDREAFEGGGRFRDDDRVPLGDLLVAVVRGRGDDVARRIDCGRRRLERLPVDARDLMILEPMLVTAQAFLQPQRGLIGAGIGVGGKRVCFEHDAGIEVNHAFGAEAESLFADGDVPREAAVEILGGGLHQALIDARAQRRADVDVLARDAKRHDRPPMSAGR